MATRIGQKLNSILLAVPENFMHEIISKSAVQGIYYGLQPQIFVNIDETAGFLEGKPNSAVLYAGANTTSVCCYEINTRHVAACMSVCRDGTKLPTFFVFIAEPNGHIEKDIDTILPSGIYGCCQSND